MCNSTLNSAAFIAAIVSFIPATFCRVEFLHNIAGISFDSLWPMDGNL